ncbi:hypothetical protein BDV93DRAFT_444059, partial [Ceratobasidium sp. AG-I]
VLRHHSVAGEQGDLRGLMELPTEVFTLIACHATPYDLISLGRSNKLLRKMLLHRSAANIWQRAERNVPGLPLCPGGMCEPQYAVLIFFEECTVSPIQFGTW